MNPIEILKADVRRIDQQFLDKFKDLPGLWDPAHAEYCNKYHRNANLKKLLPIIQKLKPNATIIDVKTKINTLRTNYRKEYNRIKDFISLNPDKKDFIKPRLWYFKSLLFLNTIKSKHNPEETNELIDIKCSETSNESEENCDDKEPVSTPSTSQTRPHTSSISTELTEAFSSFKPEPVYVESDNEERAGPSNVDDETERREGPTDDIENDEIEPMRDKIIECERNFLITFRKLPGLWNPSDPYYTNRVSRNIDLNKLLPFLKKINPKSTIDDVRKKINTFRSNYRRELKKIEHSKSVDPDFVYKPKLWYYKYMSFLNDLEDSKEREEKITEDDVSDNESAHLEVYSPTSFTVTLKPRKRKPSENKLSEEDEKATQFLINQNQQIDPVFEWEEISPIPKRKPKRIKDNTVNVPETDEQFSINQDPEQIKNPIVFEWDESLSRLDSKQRLFAKKAISDILYEAELGNLHAGSVRINQNQSSVCQFDQPSSSSQFDQSRLRLGENVILVKMEGGDPLS